MSIAKAKSLAENAKRNLGSNDHALSQLTEAVLELIKVVKQLEYDSP